MKAKSAGQPRNPSNELLAGLPVSDWSAKQLMQFAGEFLQKVENKDIDYLDEHYSDDLAKHLSEIWPNTKVYWSPAREKSKESEFKREPIELNDISKAKEFLNYLIINLNQSYHSIPFLHQFIDYTNIPNAHVFKVWPDDKGINFQSFGINDAKGLSWCFRLKRGVSCNQYIDKFVSKYSQSFKEQLADAKLDLVDYLAGWANFEPNVVDALYDFWKEHAPFANIMTESKRAMQHFALMSLFIINNQCSAASYFISITPDSEHDSSMVIYWPSGNIPDNTIHYLLKMLLGLNASPFLNALEQTKASYELMEYFGHSMKNRLAPIMQYCDDKKSRNNARRSVHLISDSMVLLRLKRVQSVEDLFANDKTRDFLLKAVPENKPLDIYNKLRTEWKKIIDGSEGLVKLDSGNQVAAIYKIKVPPSKDASNAIVSFGIRRDQDHYRLSDHVYRELFLELLLNICRHSQANEIVYDEKRKKYKAHIEVQLNWSHVDNKSVLILSNFVGSNKLPGYLNETTWTPWPYGRSHSGPGMAISFLRRLKLGDIWYLRQQIGDPSIVSGERLHVAVHLNGFPRAMVQTLSN